MDAVRTTPLLRARRIHKYRNLVYGPPKVILRKDSHKVPSLKIEFDGHDTTEPGDKPVVKIYSNIPLMTKA